MKTINGAATVSKESVPYCNADEFLGEAAGQVMICESGDMLKTRKCSYGNMACIFAYAENRLQA